MQQWARTSIVDIFMLRGVASTVARLRLVLGDTPPTDRGSSKPSRAADIVIGESRRARGATCSVHTGPSHPTILLRPRRTPSRGGCAEIGGGPHLSPKAIRLRMKAGHPAAPPRGFPCHAIPLD